MNMKQRTLPRLVTVGAIAASLTITVLSLESDNARSVGIATVMTEKSLPEATIAVIDPESGTSSGTSGSDVNIAVGDIILFRFAFSPVPDGRNRSMQAWLTEYIPPGTELVGARIIDEDGLTILPRYPGLAVDGCAGGSSCNSFSNVPCSNGVGAGGTSCSGNQRDLAGGTISQVHADTGIFWSNSAHTARRPNDRFITLENGIVMDPVPAGISPDLTQIIDKTSGPYHAHNTWDWAQVLAYGVTGGGTNGRGEPVNPTGAGGDGNTPFLYGSPVAGPHTFYRYEASPTVNGSGNITAIRFDDEDGPWRRVRYPGSKIGFGDCLDNTGGGSNVNCTPDAPGTDFTRNIANAAGIFTGDDVTPASAVSPTAVRFALGEMRTGDPVQVELALRVTQVPFDPNYAPSGDNVNCGEVIGSSLAQRATGQDGSTHPWVTYLGTPACVFLKLLLDVTTDKPLSAGQTSTFTMRLKNLKTTAETGVVAYMQFSNNRISFLSATPPPDAPGLISCPAPLDTSKSCVRWTVGTMNPSDEFLVDATFNAGGGGNTSGVLQGVYTSTSLPAPGFSSSDLTVITPIAKINAAMSFPNPTTTFAASGGTATITGTLSNGGTQDFSFDRVVLFLPSGWTVADGADAGNVADININGVAINCSANCTTNTPTFPHSVTYSPGTSRPITAVLNVPGVGMGVYPIDLQLWGTQTGFGGNWETYFPAIAEVPVAAVRTEPPIIDCLSLGSTSSAITGTSEPNATVRALFNLIERGNDDADGTGDWSVTNFTAFGSLYGGLEVRATAQVTGENVSQLSLPCATASRRECSDGLDNDLDGAIDFPADPGCDSPTDNTESNPVTQCSDGIDNNGTGGTDWPIDPSCATPDDPTENGVPACSDGIDNDGDTDTDFPNDSDCTSATDATEEFLRQCQDRIDNDGDGRIDFDGRGNPALIDPDCHSAFDDDESTPSFVDDARGRILVVFDTSGSMNRNTCENDPADSPFTGGDGSLDCSGDDVLCADIPAGCTAGQATCGNGVADDSRLYKVKAGISDVVASFGEVEYALMRFSQRGVDFACPVTNAGLRSGGWQGGGLSPCGGGFNGGDVVVGFARDNPQTMLELMDGETNYPIGDPPARLDMELRGSGSTPLGGSLVSALAYLNGVEPGDPFAGCRQYRVILVTDGDETCGGNPTQAAMDLYNAGYPVTVIGFATGDPGIDAQLDAIANAGSDPLAPRSAIFVSDEAALSAAMAQVVQDSIVFETCDGADNDCDGNTDEGFPVGGACDNGERGVCLEPGTIVCSANGQTTECDAPAGTPDPPETCNSLDDDCDGKVDEFLVCNCLPEICNGQDDDCDGNTDEGTLPGEGDDCGIDIPVCTPGTLACNRTMGDPDFGTLECLGGTGPTTEICDGLDNDCDTFIDEVAIECYTGATGCTLGNPSACVGTCSTGVQTCVNPGTPGSTLGACTGEIIPNDPEFCDGFDDDCDGSTDESYPLGMACDNGQDGVCNVGGVLVCNAARDGVECNAPPVTPGLEICNGLDDDCDGTPDNNLPMPPIGEACGGGGGCSGGTFQCVPDGMGGANIECTGQSGGSPETCNGLDDDCDMRIDEMPTDPELNPPPGDDCTLPGFETQGDMGECEFGNYICQAGMIVCDGYIGPRPETCNGLDDDCDGMVDDMATCPSPGEICLDGECVGPCMPGEFPCPFGFQCNTFPDNVCATPPCRFCVSDPCVDVVCQTGFACDSDTGQCVDLCEGINCQANASCVNGFCLDCFQLGCAPGEVCTAGDGCVADPCTGVDCGADGFCRDGDCVPLGCEPDCAVGQFCNDGTCEDDLCTGTTCGQNQVCRPSDGECIGDVCSAVNCPNGQACHPGTGDCIDDPCRLTDCPPGKTCSIDLDGDAVCGTPEPPKGDEGEYVYASGGGCSTSGGSSGTAPLLVLLGAVLALRRRRRPVGSRR